MLNQDTRVALEQEEYNSPLLLFNSNGKEILVMSDLHLAAGINANGNYDGTENFFADQSFQRFIKYIYTGQLEKKHLLIINGDFIDFLRIRDYPESEEQLLRWQQILAKTGINKTIPELQASISKKEIDFGLKTHDYKTIWKLMVCFNGHRILFEELAKWLYQGNEIIITKGNHDLEWYWPAVRVAFQFLLADLGGIETWGSIYQNLHFADAAVVVDEQLYIEHGHVYENLTAVKGDATINNGTELNLPFGSFFNRYLINRLELAYPFLDNVKPSKNVLPVLLRERFPIAVKVLGVDVPHMLFHVIPKKLYWQTFKYLFHILLVIVLPIAITALAVYLGLKGHDFSSLPGVVTAILSVLRNLGLLFLSYVFGRLLSMAQLTAPFSFKPFAEKILSANPDIRVVTFGHSHNPEQVNFKNRYYINTGTWMPVYDLSMGSVRIDATYTFLQIVKDASGNMIKPQLLRWNDDACRADSMLLTDRS